LVRRDKGLEGVKFSFDAINVHGGYVYVVGVGSGVGAASTGRCTIGLLFSGLCRGRLDCWVADVSIAMLLSSSELVNKLCTVHKRGEVRTDERGGVGNYSKVK
jgi:hypothetical protein